MTNAMLYPVLLGKKIYMVDPDICCIDSGSDFVNLSWHTCVACKQKCSQYVGWMKLRLWRASPIVLFVVLFSKTTLHNVVICKPIFAVVANGC